MGDRGVGADVHVFYVHVTSAAVTLITHSAQYRNFLNELFICFRSHFHCYVSVILSVLRGVSIGV